MFLPAVFRTFSKEREKRRRPKRRSCSKYSARVRSVPLGLPNPSEHCRTLPKYWSETERRLTAFRANLFRFENEFDINTLAKLSLGVFR